MLVSDRIIKEVNKFYIYIPVYIFAKTYASAFSKLCSWIDK